MRILFLPFSAAKSHVFHITPIASALRTAGHEVRVASSPDLAQDIARAGLTAESIGSPMWDRLVEIDDEFEPDAEDKPTFGDHLPVQTEYALGGELAELEYLVENFVSHIVPDDMLADLVALARDWRPDLVVSDQMVPVGAVAARACGAAYARFLWGTDSLVQLRQKSLDAGDPLGDWLRTRFAAFGLPYDERDVEGDWTIDATPAWMWHPQGPRYVRVRHLAYNGPLTVPAWLHETPSRPRVCVTLGVSMDADGVLSLEDIAAAVADLDAEVVVTLGQPVDEDTPKVPDNVRLVEFAPLNVMLPTCAAVVHHGGAGSFSAALEYGVPQVIVPPSYWVLQWFGPTATAAGIAEQGAGRYAAANSEHLSPATFREALVQVLEEPSYRREAERLRIEALGEATPNELVPVLERLVTEVRVGGGA